MRNYLSSLIIAFALSVGLGYQAKTISTQHICTYLSFCSASQPTVQAYRKMIIEPAWATRCGSTYMASRTVNTFSKDGVLSREAFSNAVATWTAGLFFLFCLLCLFAGRHALLCMFAAFAAVSYNYTAGVEPVVVSWDLPALLAFAVLMLLAVAKKPNVLMFAIPILMPFKETVAVFSFVFLFWPNASWKGRVLRFVLAGGMAALVKFLLGYFILDGAASLSSIYTNTAGGTAPVIAKGATEPVLRCVLNLQRLLDPRWNHPLLINAGLLAAFILAPIKGTWTLAFKCVLFLHAVGIFAFGELVEFRIWLEMVPLALYTLVVSQDKKSGGEEAVK